MKKIFLLLTLLCASLCSAQNFMSMTASNIQNGGGTKLANGQITFLGVDNNNNPLSYQAGGGGQVIKKPVACSIVNGAITGTCNVANSALTNPTNVCFRTEVLDQTTGTKVINGSGYNCVQPGTGSSQTYWCAGGSCNFDLFIPSSTAGVVTQFGPQGPPGATGATGPPGSGTTASVVSSLPAPSTAGNLLLLSTGFKNFSIDNGASIFSPSAFDSNPLSFGADRTGATDATTALQNAIESNTTPNGLGMYIPSGTYLVNSPLHIDHTMHISGAGGAPGTPGTTLQLGPASYVQVDFPNTNAANTSGRGDFSLIENLKIVGTSVSCTATSGSLVLTACPTGVATTLALTAGQPVTVMGTLSTPGYGLAFPQFTTVGSTTSTTITLVSPGTSGSNFSGSVTVMNAGPLVGTGTTTDGSTTVTGLTNCAQWNGGDPIFGPGIPYVNSTTPATTTPRYIVTSKNCGTNTLVLNHAASLANAPYAPGTGNFYKAPIANVMVKGPPHLHDMTIEYSAGDCLYMAADGAWVTSADGWRAQNLRVLHCGGASLYTAGGDSNAGLSDGLFASYSVEGCVLDWSFLGNTYIGGECASQGQASNGPGGVTTGGGYNSLNLNGASLFLNPYLEGGNVAPKYNGSVFALGGVSTPFSTGGNFITNAGVMSPTFYTTNYNESQGDFLTGSAIITNVTNISHWNVGDTLTGWCSSSAVTVTASDGVSQLTMNKVSNCTQTQQWFSHSDAQQYIGSQSNLQSVGGFGITKDQTTILANELQWREYNATDNWGWYCYLWRNSTENLCFSTDYAVGKEVPPNTGSAAYSNNGGRIKFASGFYLGGGVSANYFNIVASSANPPTTGWFGQGSWAFAGTPTTSSTAAAYVETGADLVITNGHINVTAGSTSFTSADATAQTCAPNNWITGTDLENDTIIFTNNLNGTGTLSRPATATATETVACGRLPKAHIASTVTTTNTSNSVAVNSGSSTWANNDYIVATGIPTNTWVVSGGGTATLTISQNATSSNAAVAATDPSFTMQTVPLLNTSGVLPVTVGGSGTASPSLVAGTNVTISGSWPNQTVNASAGSSVLGRTAPTSDLICAHGSDTTIGQLTITAATNAAPPVFTVSTSPLLFGYEAGQTVTVIGVTPSAYNGTYTIGVTPTSTTITGSGAAPGSAYTSGGTLYMPCDNSVDALAGTPQSFTTTLSVPGGTFGAATRIDLLSQMATFTTSTAPTLALPVVKYGASTVVNDGVSQTLSASSANSVIGELRYTLSSPVAGSIIGTFGGASLAGAPASFASSTRNPTVTSTSSSQNLSLSTSFSATGIASGTYTSGGVITGTVGQTCTLATFNNGNTGATGTVALTGTNVIAGSTALVITNTGFGSTSAATTATLGSGTATCSGTATIATVLGGAQGNAVRLFFFDAVLR